MTAHVVSPGEPLSAALLAAGVPADLHSALDADLRACGEIQLLSGDGDVFIHPKLQQARQAGVQRVPWKKYTRDSSTVSNAPPDVETVVELWIEYDAIFIPEQPGLAAIERQIAREVEHAAHHTR